MKAHQRYLAFRDARGALSHHFLAISNMIVRDSETLARGYEKVLRSRFEDARFFLAEDRKKPLSAHAERLSGVVFQQGLGTIADKVTRMRALAARIAATLGLDAARTAHVDQIAALCKADLVTTMVGEFPELQGEVGRYYAQREDLPAVVADGIRDHYRPRSVEDEYPATDEAAIVALADRLDSLAGVFALGKLPTSSADPFGLRRACLTAVALCVKRGLHLDLRALLAAALDGYGALIPPAKREVVLTQVLDFALARVKVLFREEARADIPGGFAIDTIDAVVQATAPWYDVADLVKRLQAMAAFRQRPDFGDVATTFKRCNNILKDSPHDGAVDPAACRVPAEQALLSALAAAEPAIAGPLAAKDYVAALSAIAPLRAAVDAFFVAVLVNDADEAVRANRHRLLRRVVALVKQMADFSAIQDAA